MKKLKKLVKFKYLKPHKYIYFEKKNIDYAKLDWIDVIKKIMKIIIIVFSCKINKIKQPRTQI